MNSPTRILERHLRVAEANRRAHAMAEPYDGYLQELNRHISALTAALKALNVPEEARIARAGKAV